MSRKNPPKKDDEQRQPETQDDDDLASVPLFSSADSGEIAYIAISRDEPDEGYLGRLKPMATEKDIARKWGGGTYTLSARSAGGKNVKGGARTVEIGGDPIFQSVAAEQKWRKSQGLEPAGGGAKNTSGEPRPLSVTDMLLLADKSAEKAREQTQTMFAALTAMQTQAHQQQLQMLQHQQQLQRQADEQERERSREFMRTLLEMTTNNKRNDDPIGNLLKGMQIMREMGGDGETPGDPLTALASAIPGILREGRKMFAAGGGRVLANPGPEDDDEEIEDDDDEPAQLEAAEDTSDEEIEEDDDEEPGIKITGPVAEKARAAMEALQKRGIDPETAIGAAFDMLAGKLKRPAKPQPVADADASPPAARKRKSAPLKNGEASPPQSEPPAAEATPSTPAA